MNTDSGISMLPDTVPERFAERMKQTPQDSAWHGEGDVYTHTMMVVEALDKLIPSIPSPDQYQAGILRTAALLHDIGKISATIEGGSRIESPSHAPAGARMAREFLWRELGMNGTTRDMQIREAICMLIESHTLPPHLINMPDGRTRLHRLASCSILAPHFSIRLLNVLGRADIMGRISNDKEDALLRIDLCEELAIEEGCLDGCYPFPDCYTRHKVVSGAEIWKDQRLHDPTWGEVVLMSGLPGTGKDTWISTHLPELPMVSLDEVRRRLRIPPTKNQGKVANIAREQAKEMLRNRQPFVWNATNITKEMRSQLVSLFETYGARVRIVYLETSWEELLRRNASREEMVPERAILDMLGKLSVPRPHEARHVEWHVV